MKADPREASGGTAMKSAFYGWRIVTASMIMATVNWSLGVFGMGVYIYALTTRNGFSLSVVSGAVTVAYIVGALMTLNVGRFTARYGPKPVALTGATVLAVGVALLPVSNRPWHLYTFFLLVGFGMSCLSTTFIGTTLAPWFERHQGKAMSTAMLGASIGGIIGTPMLLAGVTTLGFGTTMTVAALVAVTILYSIALLVLVRHPRDIGQWPDGEAALPGVARPPQRVWSRSAAFRTRQFQSQIVAFGIGLLVQVGFLAHHVSIALPVVGQARAGLAVSAAAIAAFVGRLLLAKYADRIDVRRIAAGVFAFAALSLAGVAHSNTAAPLFLFSILYGLTVGNVTTLAPIIIRREFGAASFGEVFGLAGMFNQLALAIGPAAIGFLRDWYGTYAPVLYLASLLDVVAAIAIWWGGRGQTFAGTVPDPGAVDAAQANSQAV